VAGTGNFKAKGAAKEVDLIGFGLSRCQQATVLLNWNC